MTAWKVVGPDHKSLWVGGVRQHPCGDTIESRLKQEGIDVPASARKPLGYEVGAELDGGPAGVFCFDSRNHLQITHGAWRRNEGCGVGVSIEARHRGLDLGRIAASLTDLDM
jgi:hypothetical protein